MSHIKSSLLGCLLAFGTAITSSAYAYTPLNNTSTSGLGPSTLSFVGQNVPCHASFTFNINSGGALAFTGATFTQQSGDSSFCPSMTANGLPWTVGAASLVSGSGPTGTYTATISGISITVPGIHVTCTGSATLTINDATGEITINGTLHNGTIPCGFSAQVYANIKAP
jgi:hypothetical protein